MIARSLFSQRFRNAVTHNVNQEASRVSEFSCHLCICGSVVQQKMLPGGMTVAGDLCRDYCTVRENVAVCVVDPAAAVTSIE